MDEIQDYTQAEIALFFYLGSPGGLFLAGDTAQNVVEGVEFRFEEIRSVCFSLFKDQKYVPAKPSTVNVNFRSHSGILNIASDVLQRMFDAFPRSATKLAPDVGAFAGPRPSLLRNVSNDLLKKAVSMIDGVVLLTHDENVNALRALVGEDVLVFGIRYSKGLEFPHVIIVDFFSSLDKSLEKAFKNVFSIRSNEESGVEDLKDTSPEVETQLKLLYTAITRCSKRLFFAETKRSGAGEAFRKWSTIERNDKRTALAVEQSVDDVERLKKTADEWVASGVQMGSEAEISNDLEQSQFWLKQAVFDFRKGNNAELEKRAAAHLSATELQAKISKNADLSRELEMEASAAILQLIKVSMVDEARKTMIDYISPFVSEYTKERLRKYVLKSINPPAEED